MMDNDRTQPRRRLRLAPAQRVPQILDAALQEFSRRGFTAARMDDIARRCGLSKGGLYAHFDSKDAIFKALLDRTLNRTDWAQMPQLAAGANTRAVAQWTVDRLHAALLAPEVITLLRLLIPERERVPLRVDEWKKLTQQHTRDPPQPGGQRPQRHRAGPPPLAGAVTHRACTAVAYRVWRRCRTRSALPPGAYRHVVRVIGLMAVVAACPLKFSPYAKNTLYPPPCGAIHSL